MNKEELIIGFFEKGYCCDLDEVKDTCLGLLKENKKLKEKFKATNKGLQKVLLRSKKWKHRYELVKHEIKELKSQLKGTTHCFDEEEHKRLKKQLEEINKMIEKCGFINIEQVMLNYCGLLTQQKEFMKWLENGIEKVKNTEFLDERIQRAGLIAYNRCLRKYKKIVNGTKRN